MVAMYEKSPIQNALNVDTPVLFVIGAVDLRVPPSQGINFYRILKSMGAETELHLYPNGNHPISDLESSLDVIMNYARWCIKYLD